MTTHHAHPGLPRALLVIDPAVLVDAEAATLSRLVDRLMERRQHTLIVLLGREVPADLVLPSPDYTISARGRDLLRQPGDEPVSGWPPETGDVNEETATRYLAERLLIPPGNVFSILSPRFADAFGIDLEEGCGAVTSGGGHPSVAVENPDAVVQGLLDVGFTDSTASGETEITNIAFERALESLRRNVTEHGFTAASLSDNALMDHDANYASVWARDGIMTGLASLSVPEPDLHDCFERTLDILARFQSPSGQIPANVRIQTLVPEYSGAGGIASIDSPLWFVIGLARYSILTGKLDFAERHLAVADRAMTWLAAHDSNNDGLIEVPEASDWMDLFPRSYNVLYDEVLWHRACADHAALRERLGHSGDDWRSHAKTVKRRILELFWPSGRQFLEQTGSGTGRFSLGEGRYLLSHITPFDYSWRCDVLANLLASLSNIVDKPMQERIFLFLWGVGVSNPYPVRCLYPAVQSGADDWKDYFLVNFLNLPHHYHNGGVWPFIGGLWVTFLKSLGRHELAHHQLVALAESCRQGIHGEWEFNEWLHGETGRPMGKAHQAWSSASFIQARQALHEVEGLPLFATIADGD
jgi:glycogen debranching enzyme